MKIAIEGCAHGELEKIYECIETLQERENFKIDLLICCGDFQSVRNRDDLKAMAVPEKYQQMCSFYKYYSGEKQAPILTIFIGGNHEASNYLQELPYGGWVAPNIYYLGRAGVVKFGNLRIGGISGIFKGRDYNQGLWECLPYSQNSLRSVYHIRSFDVFRLSQLKEKVDIMLSHDWPRGIHEYGDKQNLIKRKPFLREDIESNQLGSMPTEKLLHLLKPDYWFSAHLHCQFAALVKHDENTETKFLALDKCLPKRRHLQILDLPENFNGDMELKYDLEWLSILKNTNHLMTVKNCDSYMPGPGGNERYDYTPTENEKETIGNQIGSLIIDSNDFVKTAPVFNPAAPKNIPLEPLLNPQTLKLCEKLGIDDPIQVVMARSGRAMKNVDSIQQNELMDIVRTPIKSLKLSLPPPVTPSEDSSCLGASNDSSLEHSTELENTTFESECSTPSTVHRRTFKRRNISIYNTDEGEDGDKPTNSFIDADKPLTNKLLCRSSEL